MVAVSQVEPMLPSAAADIIATENVAITPSSPMAFAPGETSSMASDVPVQVLEEPEEPAEPKDEVALSTPGEPAVESPAEESNAAVSELKVLGSTVPSEGTRNSFASKQHYRGPEDQLIHARNLAEVRKFWESEQVLKDLLGQRPPSPIQAEASILLVKVLSSQNRIGEAQQILDDAKVQFPASEMIQTYDLKQ